MQLLSARRPPSAISVMLPLRPSRGKGLGAKFNIRCPPQRYECYIRYSTIMLNNEAKDLQLIISDTSRTENWN